MVDVDHLSLYAERDNPEQDYCVRNFPSRGNRTPEQAAVESLAAEGWRLVSIAPTYSQRVHRTSSHLLNFERVRPTTRNSVTSRFMRLLTQHGEVKTIRSIPWTNIGHVARAGNGLTLKFLGITRLINGVPDVSLLGEDIFMEDTTSLMTGLVSINGSQSIPDEHRPQDIYCQFVYENFDGSYRDDVHPSERFRFNHEGLIVGMAFGAARLTPRLPVRNSRFEYIVFTGSPELGVSPEMLIRFRFEMAPR